MMTRTVGILVCLIAIMLLGVWFIPSTARVSQLESSKSEQASPAPDGIVGSETCVKCHADIAERYLTSGHAHTFHRASDSEIARRLDGTQFVDPQRHDTFRYQLGNDGLQVSLPGIFGGESFPLLYALGSGTHAVTFLTLLPHKDGGTVGLEHRVTYYAGMAGLGLTVGHPYLPDPVEDAEQFGKVLDATQVRQCLGCHTTRNRIENHEVVDLLPHVGCEKCHGPGAEHVAAARRGQSGPDVSPAHRWPTALDELRTCGACHRLPESLKASELSKTSRVLPRFQPAGLMQSRCYTQSEGALRCTTCHDPHAKTSTDHARYEQTCRECHHQQSVADCPKSTDRCIDCHMPAIDFEGVAAFHDHWIRIRTEEDPAPRRAP